MGYPPPRVRYLTRYSAVCYYPHSPKTVEIVQLACIKRAASVRPEPGSNSLLKEPSFHYSVVKVSPPHLHSNPHSLYLPPTHCQCHSHLSPLDSLTNVDYCDCLGVLPLGMLSLTFVYRDYIVPSFRFPIRIGNCRWVCQIVLSLRATFLRESCVLLCREGTPEWRKGSATDL